jgi:cytochrome c-type biogenesis protein CcmH/NrfG
MASLILSGCGETLTDAEYLARARDYQEKGEINSSTIELKNALKVNLDNIEARWMLGNIYLDSGKGPAAEKELTRAMELGMAPEAVVVPLASALLLQNKFQEVLDLEVDYAALDSRVVATVWALQGHAYLGLNELEEAVNAYEKAQNLNSGEPEGQGA